MNDLSANLAFLIKVMREQNKLSVRDLANKTGLSPITISSIERHKRDMGVTTASKIANVFEIKLGDFFNLAEEISPQRRIVADAETSIQKVEASMHITVKKFLKKP